MNFVYPPNLVDEVKKRWSRHHGPRRVILIASWDSKQRLKIPRTQTSKVEPGDPERFPFPRNRPLSYFLDVLYHSSFMTEESRRIALRVTYLPHDLSEEKQNEILNH